MSYNTRNPAVKRLMKEAQELSEPTELYHAKPLEDNLFEWHFTIRGPTDTDFDGGIYHGRIILPTDYPMKPPNILLLTANGRFEVNRKICLSISGYHPETWRPSWSIRTALLAIIGFMPTHGVGAIGSLDYPPEQRRRLAKESVHFSCPECGPVGQILLPLTQASKKDVEEAQSLATQISFHEPKSDKPQASEVTATTSASSPDVKPNEEKTSASVEAVPSSSSGPMSASLAPNLPAGYPTVAPWMWMMMPPGGTPGAVPAVPPGPSQAPSQPLSFIEWLEQVKQVQLNQSSSASPASTGNENSLRQRQTVPIVSSAAPSTSSASSSPTQAEEPPATPITLTPQLPPRPVTTMEKVLQIMAVILVLFMALILLRKIVSF